MSKEMILPGGGEGPRTASDDLDQCNVVVCKIDSLISEEKDESLAITPSLTLKDEIDRLSKLTPLDYDLVRQQAAKSLGVRVTTLDAEIEKFQCKGKPSGSSNAICEDVEPYRQPIDLAELLDEIYALIRRHIICSDATASAVTLWIAMTWCIDYVHTAPIAMITAPEKRCGKTQLLDIMRRLVRRPLAASSISPAAVYRVIEAEQPTLLIDEADAFLRNNEDMRGILNCGHTRTSAYVIRTVGDEHTPKKFSTFGAKAISGIGHQAETLMDRSVVLQLRRKLSSEFVEALRHAKPDYFNLLARKLARFAADYAEQVAQARPHIPHTLNDRAADNWEPLLAIADLAGESWPGYARRSAVEISGDEAASPSINEELLSTIRDIFEEQSVQKIWLTSLLEALVVDPEAPWATWNKGRPMSVRQLSNRLKDFDVFPQSVKISGKNNKGFKLEQFEEAFERYLTVPCEAASSDIPPSSVAQLQPSKNNDSTATKVYCISEANNSRLPLKSLNIKDCNQVTDMARESPSTPVDDEWLYL